MRISDWSSDVCSSDLFRALGLERRQAQFTFDLFENPLGRDRLSIASATFDALPIGVHDAGSRSDIEVCIRPSLRDRKSVVEGKSVSVRVDFGGSRIIKKKK